MAFQLDGKLVVGISSRALFDLERENAIFETEGIEIYAKYQREHENDVLKPGTAFSLVRALHQLNAGGKVDRDYYYVKEYSRHQSAYFQFY